MPTAAIRGTRTARIPAYVPVLASLVSLGFGASAFTEGRRNWRLRGRLLVQVVAVFLDVLLKLRAKGLKKEEADKAGGRDLTGTSTEDLGNRVDDHHEGEEGEDNDEHDDGGEGFHCSDCLSVQTKPITRVRGYRVELGLIIRRIKYALISRR